MQDHLAVHQHSNVVRLYNAFIDKRKEGYFGFYIPGVGTPFPEIGETAYTKRGKAVAWGGEKRINWGLLQIYNAIHFYLKNEYLILGDQSKTIVDNISSIQLGLGNHHRRLVLSTWEDKLKAVIKSTKPVVQQINISVFGFSRGAAEARAFCNWFFELCDKKDGGYTFADVPVRIQFLGIFDTVASVGLANMVSIAEGHMAWADDNMHIHPAVERCVHFVAAHEVRACFPLDSARRGNSYPPNCKEVVYPGAHSDVGGGYGPNDQGKSDQIPDKKKYSFIALLPAIDMYHEARKSGVPLMTMHEMPPRIRRDFDPDPDMVKLYNRYLALSNVGIQPVEKALRSHMQHYFRYRKLRADNLLNTYPYTKANPGKEKDRDFLRITNESFKQVAASLEGAEPANKALAEDPAAYYNSLREARRNAADKNGPLPYARKLTQEDQDIVEALKTVDALSEEMTHFFDHYVHDSIAGFAQDGVNEYRFNGRGHLRYRKVFVENG